MRSIQNCAQKCHIVTWGATVIFFFANRQGVNSDLLLPANILTDMSEDLASAIVAAAENIREEDAEYVSFACVLNFASIGSYPCQKFQTCSRLMKGGTPCNRSNVCSKMHEKVTRLGFRIVGTEIESSTCILRLDEVFSRLRNSGFTVADEGMRSLLHDLVGSNHEVVAMVMSKNLSRPSSKRCAGDFTSRIVSTAQILDDERGQKEYVAITVTSEGIFRVVIPFQMPSTHPEYRDAMTKCGELGYRDRETSAESFLADLQRENIRFKDSLKIVHVYSKPSPGDDE